MSELASESKAQGPPAPPGAADTGRSAIDSESYPVEELGVRVERALAGNLHKEGEKLARQGKLFVRDRLALLLDEGSFVEDGLLANTEADGLPADGVVTGVGRVGGRPVCVVANDPTVKAGSWGARTVEKIV